MAYDTYEAARLISWSNKQAGIGPLSEGKLIEWINAGVGGLDWAFTYKDNREEIWYIDFPSLISLRLICLLHFESPDSKGTSLKEITAAAGKLRKELGTEWPFASKMLWDLHDKHKSNGFYNLEEGKFKNPKEEWKYVYRQLWGERHRKATNANLVYGEDGIACAWLPVEGIKIDPQFVSGSPCLAGTRIPTWVFPGMHEGGDSIEELAEDYCITVERVEQAMEWERQLASAGV